MQTILCKTTTVLEHDCKTISNFPVLDRADRREESMHSENKGVAKKRTWIVDRDVGGMAGYPCGRIFHHR